MFHLRLSILTLRSRVRRMLPSRPEFIETMSGTMKSTRLRRLYGTSINHASHLLWACLPQEITPFHSVSNYHLAFHPVCTIRTSISKPSQRLWSSITSELHSRIPTITPTWSISKSLLSRNTTRPSRLTSQVYLRIKSPLVAALTRVSQKSRLPLRKTSSSPLKYARLRFTWTTPDATSDSLVWNWLLNKLCGSKLVVTLSTKLSLLPTSTTKVYQITTKMSSAEILNCPSVLSDMTLLRAERSTVTRNLWVKKISSWWSKCNLLAMVTTSETNTS